jgi:hypothetical protein
MFDPGRSSRSTFWRHLGTPRRGAKDRSNGRGARTGGARTHASAIEMLTLLRRDPVILLLIDLLQQYLGATFDTLHTPESRTSW